MLDSFLNNMSDEIKQEILYKELCLLEKIEKIRRKLKEDERINGE